MQARRALLVVGALVAVIVLFIAGDWFVRERLVTQEPEQRTTEGATADSNRLQNVLLPPSSYPPGSDVRRVSFREAMTGQCAVAVGAPEQLNAAQSCAVGFMQDSPDLVITPYACSPAGVRDAFGDPANIKAGALQLGALPPDPNGFRQDFFDLATVVAGGLNFDVLRRNIEACKSGTLKMPTIGVTGTLRWSEFKAPALDRAQTFGLLITSVSRAKDPKLAGTHTQAIVFVNRDDGTVIASCDAQVQAATERATAMYQRA